MVCLLNDWNGDPSCMASWSLRRFVGQRWPCCLRVQSVVPDRWINADIDFHKATRRLLGHLVYPAIVPKSISSSLVASYVGRDGPTFQKLRHLRSDIVEVFSRRVESMSCFYFLFDATSPDIWQKRCLGRFSLTSCDQNWSLSSRVFSCKAPFGSTLEFQMLIW